ncbi:MAG: hypothetical protein ACETWM_00360 [Candidatus Lokiarchaeia archaeon]
MPVFGKDKKEGYLDSPANGQPAKNPNPKKDSEIINEVKSGIERLSQILSTYLSSFEERLGTIEKQIGSLDNRITSIEKITRKSLAEKSIADKGGIVVPSELVEDATRTRPAVTKKMPESVPSTEETVTVSPEIPKPAITPPTEPAITIPKTEIPSPKVEAPVSVPTTEEETQTAESAIPLSREVPVAENFFDELKARINKKSSQLQEETVYKTKPEPATVEETKETAQVQTSERPREKTEEDIRMVLQRLKDSISKAE